MFIWDDDELVWVDDETGDIVPLVTQIGWRDRFVASVYAEARALADQVGEGVISVAEFERQLRDLQQRTALAEYMLAVGGSDQMDDDDFAVVIAWLLQQWSTYLRPFVEEIIAGRYTNEDGSTQINQVGSRAEKYIAAAIAVFELGRGQLYQVQLPAHPVIDCQFGAYCRCYWRLRREGTLVYCTWVRTAAESCSNCVTFENEYSEIVWDTQIGAFI